MVSNPCVVLFMYVQEPNRELSWLPSSCSRYPALPALTRLCQRSVSKIIVILASTFQIRHRRTFRKWTKVTQERFKQSFPLSFQVSNPPPPLTQLRTGTKIIRALGLSDTLQEHRDRMTGRALWVSSAFRLKGELTSIDWSRRQYPDHGLAITLTYPSVRGGKGIFSVNHGDYYLPRAAANGETNM
jgi:hypothetical protein